MEKNTYFSKLIKVKIPADRRSISRINNHDEVDEQINQIAKQENAELVSLSLFITTIIINTDISKLLAVFKRK